MMAIAGDQQAALFGRCIFHGNKWMGESSAATNKMIAVSL